MPNMKKTLFTFLYLSSLVGFSQTKINYKKADGLLDVTPYIAYMADSSDKMTFEQVRALPYSAFTQNNKVGLRLRSTNYPCWFRIEIEDLKIDEELYLTVGVYARIIDVYSINNAGEILIYNNESLLPFSGNYTHTYRNISNLKHPKTIYFRLTSNGFRADTEVTIGTIQYVFNSDYNFNLFYGGIIAIIIALALYNLFLFFSLKDSIFLYYSLMTFYNGFLNMKYHGLTRNIFDAKLPFFTFDNTAQLFISSVLSVIFITKFLNTKIFSPWLHKLFLILLFLEAVLLPFDWAQNSIWKNDLFWVLQISISCLALFAGFYIWKLGYEPAKYFTFAWFFYLLGSILLCLGLLEVISLNNIWNRNAWQIGNLIEVLFASFAVAYRFNLFRKEARDAQALVLQRSEENEKLLLVHNQILEEKLHLEHKISTQPSPTNVETLLEKLQSERGKNKKLAVSTVEGVLLLPIPDIIRIEALGSYCSIFLTNNKKIIASKNLAEFEPLLDKTEFLRVHKSHLVNISFVERYIRGEGGMVVMSDGAEVSVSRTMKAELLERLNIG